MNNNILSGVQQSFSGMENLVAANSTALPGAFERVLGKNYARTELEKIIAVLSWLQQEIAAAEEALEKGDSLFAMAEIVSAQINSLPSQFDDLPEFLEPLNQMLAGIKPAGAILEKAGNMPSPDDLEKLKDTLSALSIALTTIVPKN